MSEGFLRERLGWPKQPPPLKTRSIAREEDETLIVDFQIVETEPGIRLPVIGIGPKDSRGGLVILIPGRDRVAIARAGTTLWPTCPACSTNSMCRNSANSGQARWQFPKTLSSAFTSRLRGPSPKRG